MYAQIPEIPGTVAQVSPTMPSGLTAEQQVEWHPCGANVVAGWSFDGGGFVAPIVAPSAPVLTAEQILQSAALQRLVANDAVATRCVKAGVVYPANWLAFDVALRAIANGTDTTSTDLPATPTFPAGT